MTNKETDIKTVLQIKNMVCPRCIMVVRDKLQQIGLKVLHVELGYAEVDNISESDMSKIGKILDEFGFELMHNKERMLVEQIKILVIEYVHQLERKNKEALSVFLSRKLGSNYACLSRLFAKIEGRTIQRFLVLQKIERVKELLDYNELRLNQIAVRLQYSSVHYLSSQFKMVTGVSVSSYKEEKKLKRKPLDGL